MIDVVRERGPMTVAAFMELALYDSDVGYYARSAQRSGRAGDFFTSVDVGPLFGELLATQIAEMATMLEGGHTGPPLHAASVGADLPHAAGVPADLPYAADVRADLVHAASVGADLRVGPFDLVEAGASNGRLSADILRTLREHDPNIYSRVRLHLVETSAAARDAQPSVLGGVRERLCSSSAALPDSFEGVLIANELLDALPVHLVVMRDDGLKEMYVDRDPERVALRTIEGPLSTPALQQYIDRLGITLEPGWRVELNLRAVDWIRDAARRLRRGFIILIDYGHEARELYSASHAHGTLTTFTQHRSGEPEEFSPAWLQNPGDQDITAHVDFTSVRDAAEAEGLTTVAFLDQTYFILGLVNRWQPTVLADRARALKTLMMPGGLGSTHKVMILGKGVGTQALAGCSFGGRVT